MQMKNINKKSTLISGFCLIMLTVLFSVSQPHAQAQTITYKGDVKLPPLVGRPVQLINDSGLNATDLDVRSDPSDGNSRSRILLIRDRVWTMFNDANGKPYFVTTSARVNLGTENLNERHNDISPTLYSPNVFPYLTGTYGAFVYRVLTPINDNPVTLVFTLPTTERAVSHGGIYGGKTTTIFATSEGGNFLQLYSVDVGQTRGFYENPLVTPLLQSGAPESYLALSGQLISQTFGTDGNLYVLDTVGKRIMTFDLGLNGGTRGTLLSSFFLDPQKAADNSLTMDFAGNLYVGDGAGGFNMYSKEGQWKMGFSDTYTPDPNGGISTGRWTRPYINFYASGLTINGVPDGHGTLDIYDPTGYRQYTIKSNISPTAAHVSVLGRVTTASGRGIRNVTITLTDSAGNQRTVTTTSFGYYRFDDVAAGQTVTITAKARQFRFAQSSIVRTTNDSVTGADFFSEQ
jgi:hypothetical protein